MGMTSIASVLVLLGLVWISAFFLFPSLVWTLLIGIALISVSIFSYLPLTLLIILWLIYLLSAVFANFHQLRKRYVIAPLLPLLKKQIPAISATERTAIEAGDTWWEKDLFCGRPHWSKLFSIPKPSLTSEEQDFLDHQVEELCHLVNDWEAVTQYQDLSPATWDYLKKEKFFGMVIPKQYGGRGFSAVAHSTIVAKLASRSVSVAVTTMVPNSLGPAELILHYGTEAQKNYYLPRLANGQDIPCFALTGPDAGSDAGNISDTGIVCRGEYQGQPTIGIRLSWDKRYITLAPVATVLGLAVHLYDPDHLLGEVVDCGITLCLIPTNHPGVEIGHRHYPMRLAFMNGPTFGNDVFIPLDWVIGGTTYIGQGWRMLMESLSIGRSISLPALATGTSKITYRLAGAYARIRRQFNMPIGHFEGIEESLGVIAGNTYTLEACRLMTAGAIDQKINPSIVSAIAKCHMTELSREVIDHAMDIHAGHMIQTGPRNYLALIHDAVPISITVEGANILTRNLIIFGQGAIRCHPYLLKEVELISAQQTNIDELDRVLMQHVGFFTSNLLRCLAYGLSGGYLIFANIKNRRVKKYQRQLTRMSAGLALIADASLMLLGGSLKRRERLSARLGDILSQLYLASAVLKYFSDQGCPGSDVDYVCYALQQCLYKIQVAYREIAHNFPHRWIGRLLRYIVFPWGQAYLPPSDQETKAVVAPMLMPSDIRERLTQYSYHSEDEQELSARLDKALAQIEAIEPLIKKLQKAIHQESIPAWYTYDQQLKAAMALGILTADEIRDLTAYEKLRQQIIQVNEFSFDLKQIIT